MRDTGSHWTFREVELVTLAVTFSGGRGAIAISPKERKQMREKNIINKP